MDMAVDARVTVLNDVRESVAAALRIPTDELDVDAELESFGVDSIIIMELMSTLSRQFSVSITPAQFMQFNTLRDLAGHVAAQGAPTVANVPAPAASAPEPDSVVTPLGPKTDSDGP